MATTTNPRPNLPPPITAAPTPLADRERFEQRLLDHSKAHHGRDWPPHRPAAAVLAPPLSESRERERHRLEQRLATATQRYAEASAIIDALVRETKSTSTAALATARLRARQGDQDARKLVDAIDGQLPHARFPASQAHAEVVRRAAELREWVNAHGAAPTEVPAGA